MNQGLANDDDQFIGLDQIDRESRNQGNMRSAPPDDPLARLLLAHVANMAKRRVTPGPFAGLELDDQSGANSGQEALLIPDTAVDDANVPDPFLSLREPQKGNWSQPKQEGLGWASLPDLFSQWLAIEGNDRNRAYIETDRQHVAR